MKVISIDIDGTALEFPEKVNTLYEDKENFIVLYTARSSKIREDTIKELNKKQIKYHALCMDKIRADIYIDDKNAGGLNWKI